MKEQGEHVFCRQPIFASARLWVALGLALVSTAGWPGVSSGQITPQMARLSGEIMRITINDPNDHWSGGAIELGGQSIILPRNLLIDLPTNRLTLQELFDQAPQACKDAFPPETGLAKGDTCNTTGVGGFASISANITAHKNVVAGDVFIEKGRESVTGRVTFINTARGYFRLNGKDGDNTTGLKVRLNDPTGRHTVQRGAECAADPVTGEVLNNCSADPRFALDPDNYTNVFATGYPICIPSTVARSFTDVLDLDRDGDRTELLSTPVGADDLLCPAANRPEQMGRAAEDSRRFAPLQLGDNLTAKGNFETAGGEQFLSAHTTFVNTALETGNKPDQPDYLFLAEVKVDAPGFQNERARMLITGFASLADPMANPQAGTDVLFWGIHHDPTVNASHEFPLASVRGCEDSAGPGACGAHGLAGAGANMFRIRYDVDFVMAKDSQDPHPTRDARFSPCSHLRNEPRFNWSSLPCPGAGASSGGIGGDDRGTLSEEWAILSPLSREIMARTGRKLANPNLTSIDILGNVATNGERLFPLGMNLGGISIPEKNEISLFKLATPFLFSGLPWTMDRRLSPGGCIDTNGDGVVDCEKTVQPLEPFPFEGLNPRSQAQLPTGVYSDPSYTNHPLSNVRNRILSFVNAEGVFNGNRTVLLWPPVDPAAMPIASVPPVIP